MSPAAPTSYAPGTTPHLRARRESHPMIAVARSLMLRLVLAHHGRGEDRGASLIEYALLVALIAVACLLAVEFFGDATGGSLSSSGSKIATAN